MKITILIISLFSLTLLTLFGQTTSDQIIPQLDSMELSDMSSIYIYKDLLKKYRNELPVDNQIKFGLKGANAAKSLGNDSLYINLYIEFVIHIYSTRLFDIEKTREQIDLIEKDVEKLNSDVLLGKLYKYQGICFHLEQDYIKALDMYSKVLEYFEKAGEYNDATGVLYNISNLYAILGDYQSAIKYSKKVLLLNPYLSKTDALLNTASANYRISFNYNTLSESDSAKYYLTKALKAINQVDDFSGNKNGFQIYCDVYLKVLTNLISVNDTKNLDSIYQKVLKCEGFKRPFYSLAILNYHNLIGNYDKIEQILSDSSLFGINRIGDKSLLYYQTQNEARKGNFRKALSFHQKYHNLNLEIMQEDKRKFAAQFDARFEVAQKDKDIKLLNEINKREELKSRILVLGLFSSIILLILGSLLFNKIRQNNRILKSDLENKKTILQQEAELRKMDQLKTRLFNNLLHELKTPLTLIISPIEYIIKKVNLDEADRKQLIFAQKNSQQLLSLSNQIMDLTKSEIEELSIHLVHFKWKDFLEDIISSHKLSAENRGLNLIVANKVNNDLYIQSDFIKLKTIINNVFYNALKYNRKGGKITFSIEEKEHILKLTLADTGKGIHQEDLPFIFNRYYQSKVVTAPEGGFGIGLSICKEYLEALNGSIKIKSKLNEGTTVSITIPKITNSKIEANIYNIEKVTTLNEVKNTSSIENIDLLTNHLLILEDHDELRTFLKINLERDYNLSFALDGEKGLELIETINPSLIITDWMMPNMNGMEFITIIRSNPKWNHIPILMLTARSFSIDQMKALRKGVDDYIVKPFEIDFLKLRIDYLIESSEIRKEEINILKENQQIFLTESVQKDLFVQEDRDIEWIGKFEDIILQNIGKFDLTLAEISQQMNISIPHLFRKVKLITGMTPKNFVDEVRYWEARRLLEEKKLFSVKSVAYSVGLKSVQNFSRKFEKRFGIKPSKYL